MRHAREAGVHRLPLSFLTRRREKRRERTGGQMCRRRWDAKRKRRELAVLKAKWEKTPRHVCDEERRERETSQIIIIK